MEEKLIKDIDNIMWVKARIEGGKLVVKAEERQSPQP
ncbi:sporulation protein YqfD [Clostridium botulinum]|nr:sporulation protein YqfD [Clostridium botulinum]